MRDRLKVYGLRHKLKLATEEELRQIADKALNKGIYSLSLVDAALDAEENLYDIGLAFKKALQELHIFLPKSINKCLWLLLQYYISQIVNGKVHPYESLLNIMDVYYGCNLYDKSNRYVGDSHDIHYFIGYYWMDDNLENNLSLTLLK